MRFSQFSLAKLAATGLVAALISPAFASSNEAWADHDRKITQKCITSSGLMNAVASSKPILFDDNVGYSAMIVRGHLKPIAGSAPKATATQEKLCLFERKTGKVSVMEVSAATR